jgi:hypothetical protein
MKHEITDEEIWSAIRYLDPDEKHKDGNYAETIAILGIVLLLFTVWLLLHFRQL